MSQKNVSIYSYNIKQILKITAAAYFSCAAITTFLLMNTTSIMAFFIFAALLLLFKVRFEGTKKGTLVPSVFCGVLFSLFISMFKFRWMIEQDSIFYMFTLPVGLYLFFEAVTNIVYARIKDVVLCEKNDTSKKKKVFFTSMAVMLIMWLPHFLRFYPGNLTNDSINQLNQAFGNYPLSNHHPLLHTAIIRLFVGIGWMVSGNIIHGIALYSVCQAIMLAASFSYLVVTLYGYGYKKIVLAAVVLFYALPAYHGDYSITMWKDIWFAAAAVVFCTTLWRLIIKLEGDNKIPLFEGIMFALGGFGFCLFRSNGLYAFIFMLVILAAIYARKNIKVIGLTAAVLAVALVVKGPVYKSLGAVPSEPTESLAIPQQQIAAVIKGGYKIRNEHKELISHLIEPEKIEELYSPNNADPIKFYIRDNGGEEYISEHKGELFKAWFQIGLKHPIIYTLAFIDQTYGYYYPDVQYWIYASQLCNDNFEDLYQDPRLSEGLCEVYDKFVQSYKKYPVWGLLYSIGAMTWVCVFTFGAAFLNQKKKMLLVFVPIICVILTILMATPIFAEFRYAYSVFTTVPLFCTLPFYKKMQ